MTTLPMGCPSPWRVPKEFVSSRTRQDLDDILESRESRKPLPQQGFSWRYRWDLNPRMACTITCFRDMLLRPLGHGTADESNGTRRVVETSASRPQRQLRAGIPRPQPRDPCGNVRAVRRVLVAVG